MKYFIFFLAIVYSIHLQGQRKFINKYSDLLEQGSTLVKSGYNFTFEKIDGSTYLYKKYYPDTKTMTHYATFDTKKMSRFNGLYQEWYDDGTLIIKGNYVKHKKEGFWLEHGLQGEYKNGLREGKWTSSEKDGKSSQEINFKDGKIHGDYIFYDSTGTITAHEIYLNGAYQKSIIERKSEGEEHMPCFSGCADISFDGDINKCCREKLLEYVYSNHIYPKIAREYDVQGNAIIQFTVRKDGKVKDIIVKRGLCKEISEMCYRIVSKMPDWEPGYQNGEPVNVLYTLPVKFSLE